jgi:signal transduction histidine kinase
VVAVLVESDQVTIRDEGPGIPEADLPHLFTRFWRGSTRRSEGAGLGLAICKEIITAHHWHLSARNSGLGAEFALRFPAEPRMVMAPEERKAEVLTGSQPRFPVGSS